MTNMTEDTVTRGDIGAAWQFIEKEIVSDKEDVQLINNTVENRKFRRENLLKLKIKLEEAIKQAES